MLGLPLGDNIRCKLLLGLSVSMAKCSNPTVALTRSRRIRRAVSGSPLKNKVAASSRSAFANSESRSMRSITVCLKFRVSAMCIISLLFSVLLAAGLAFFASCIPGVKPLLYQYLSVARDQPQTVWMNPVQHDSPEIADCHYPRVFLRAIKTPSLGRRWMLLGVLGDGGNRTLVSFRYINHLMSSFVVFVSFQHINNVSKFTILLYILDLEMLIETMITLLVSLISNTFNFRVIDSFL